MRRIFVLASVLLLGGFSAMAQEITDAQKAAQEAAQAIAQVKQTEVKAPKPNYWNNDLKTQITFGQTSLTNWAKGGYNNITLQAIVTGNANYKKDNISWTNNLQLNYGFIYSEDKPIIAKNMDRLFYEMKVGAKATKTLDYSMKFSFLSQFSNSYKYPVPHVEEGQEATRKDWLAARQLTSGLLSPATMELGLGIDWIPSKWLTVGFSPLTGGLVTATEESLRHSYGMALKKQYRDETEILDSYYRAARFQLGAKLTLDTKLKINDNFSYNSQLRLFSDYLDKPQNMRVNWDNIVNWKLAKYFSLVVTGYLIYDDRVLIMTEKYPEGHRAVQFSEGLTFGFTYSIASKKK